MTLAISIAFSALLALTLTPALCATPLKPHDQTERKGRIGAFFDRFFGRFNEWFASTTDRYQGEAGNTLAARLGSPAGVALAAAVTGAHGSAACRGRGCQLGDHQ